MKRDNLPWRPPQPASLAWGPEPHSTTYDDVYFSREDGRAESVHVFLAGNDLAHDADVFAGSCQWLAERPAVPTLYHLRSGYTQAYDHATPG